MSIHRIVGRFAAAATAVTLAVGLGLAAPASAESTVAATFRCTAVDITSSRHDLSNVVLRFAAGDQKFEGLGGGTKSRTFTGSGDFTGMVIAGAFIKAGDNGSGAGPGYGEFIDAPDDQTCSTQQSTSTPVRDGADEPKDTDQPKKNADRPKDDGGEGKRGEGKQGEGKPERRPAVASASASNQEQAIVGAMFPCGHTSVVVTSTKDLSNVVLRLSDGTDVKHQGLTGFTRTFTAPDGTTITAVFVKSGDNASGEGPGYGQRVDAPALTSCNQRTDVTPVAPAVSVVAAVVDPPDADVQTASVVQEPAPSAPVAGAAVEPAPDAARVLGVTLERSSPAAAAAGADGLARTGLSMLNLLSAAMGLLAAGVVMVQRSRRSVT